MTLLSACFIVIKVKQTNKNNNNNNLQNVKGRQNTILQIAKSPVKCHEKAFLFEAKNE